MTNQTETSSPAGLELEEKETNLTSTQSDQASDQTGDQLKETKEEIEQEDGQKNSSPTPSLNLDQTEKNEMMSRILSESPNPPEEGDLVEGEVISIEKAEVYIDLTPFGTGIIYGREFINAREIIRKINPGDKITGKVVEIPNKNGYIEISLKEARQALIWSEAEEAIKNKTVLELPVQEANKGGLIISWQGIAGFLPASQLKTEHYPRVEEGDKDKILEELKKLVGEKISVSIINADPKEGKLIFSEKSPEAKEKEKIIEGYSEGDVVEGEVTGMVDFGVFVKIEEGLEGLVHISEMDWALVEDPKQLYKVGEKVKVKIIEVKDDKVSLSIKALKENPWVEAAKKYKKDEVVDGVVIKFNKHGALVSIEEGIAGLVHVSEFGSEAKLREKLGLGKTYPFKINIFEPKEQKMTLSFVDPDKPSQPTTNDQQPTTKEKGDEEEEKKEEKAE